MSDSFKNCKMIFFILITAALIMVMIFLLYDADHGRHEGNLDIIHSFGWQVEEKPIALTRVAIPADFDPVYLAYQTIAAEAGFDLTPYLGITAVRYTYRVTNHQDSFKDTIRIHLLVARGTVIAADISSIEGDGFIHAISDSEGQLPLPSLSKETLPIV